MPKANKRQPQDVNVLAASIVEEAKRRELHNLRASAPGSEGGKARAANRRRSNDGRSLRRQRQRGGALER
jgi:hypothetical protein